MNALIAGLLATLALGSTAFAEESNTSTPATATQSSTVDVSKLKDEAQAEESSEKITNARLAAESGSKSKYSMKFNISYTGGSVEQPFDKYRPNYRGTPGTLAETSLGGSIAFAYRIDQETALRFGTGISLRTPFHNKDSEVVNNVNEKGRKLLNVSSPYVEWNKTYRVGNIMLSPSVDASLATDQYYTETVGLLGSTSASLTAVTEIENSGWQPGITGVIDLAGYKDNDLLDANGDSRYQYGIGLYPFLEYAFNDVYSFRTLFGYFNYAHYSTQNTALDFTQDTSYQSVGLGIAPMKGVYFYPNLQFVPDDVRGDRTNIAVSMTLNAF